LYIYFHLQDYSGLSSLLNTFEGWNVTTVLSLISNSSLVLGFLPARADLFLILNSPKPEISKSLLDYNVYMTEISLNMLESVVLITYHSNLSN